MTKKREQMYLNHIKDSYETLQDLQKDVVAVTPLHLANRKYNYTACLELVYGGCFLCYYSDVRDFYKDNGYKFQALYNDITLWGTYSRELAMVIWRLCIGHIEW